VNVSAKELLTRELEVLRSKITTLTLAQQRIEREAERLAAAIGELSGVQSQELLRDGFKLTVGTNR